MLRNIKFYYKYLATSFYELKGLKDLGVSYVLIGAPLVFDLKNVAQYDIPIRVIPNIAYEPYLDHQDGIIGQWIRPEDVDKYGQYVAVLEFYAPKALEKEAALFRVYAEQKQWPGNLNLLIDNLGVDLTEKAKQNLIDPVIGREKEINMIQEILCRRNKNNPLFSCI